LLRADGFARQAERGRDVTARASISIAMTTYNGANYLREQLDSIASQTLLPDELIICDDRSSDATVNIIERFACEAPFGVWLFVNGTNLGCRKNFERAIALCRGELIALADQDDVWLPAKLSHTVQPLLDRREVGLVFADADVVDESLRPMGYTMLDCLGLGTYNRELLARGAAFELELRQNFMQGACCVFRSELRDILLPIPAEGPRCHDGWIGVVLSAIAQVVLVDEPLMLYRQHGNQQIGAFAALGRRDTAALSMPGTRFTARGYLHDAEIIRDRLHGYALRYPPAAAAAARLESHVRHQQARKSMPRLRRQRLPIVLKELATLRYHRCSNGFASLARDRIQGQGDVQFVNGAGNAREPSARLAPTDHRLTNHIHRSYGPIDGSSLHT